MKRTVILSVVLVFAAALAGWAFQEVNPREAERMIHKQDGELVILDVRTPEEYREGHLEDSLNIDIYAEDFREQIDELERGKTYLVYCRSGARSARAAGIMDEMGFEDVYNMTGGFLGWSGAGLPFET